MKLRDVDFSVHGTSVETSLIQPVFVVKKFSCPGTGTCGTLRKGGLKIDTTSNPTIEPMNIHIIDIIPCLHMLEFSASSLFHLPTTS
jgi:hypothetical protein